MRYFTNREDFVINIKRLNKKKKGKYRYMCWGYAKVFQELEGNEWSSMPGDHYFKVETNKIFCKTRKGARETILIDLKKRLKYWGAEIRTGNAFDFIIGKD